MLLTFWVDRVQTFSAVQIILLLLSSWLCVWRLSKCVTEPNAFEQKNKRHDVEPNTMRGSGASNLVINQSGKKCQAALCAVGSDSCRWTGLQCWEEHSMFHSRKIYSETENNRAVGMECCAQVFTWFRLSIKLLLSACALERALPLPPDWKAEPKLLVKKRYVFMCHIFSNSWFFGSWSQTLPDSHTDSHATQKNLNFCTYFLGLWSLNLVWSATSKFLDQYCRGVHWVLSNFKARLGC